MRNFSLEDTLADNLEYRRYRTLVDRILGMRLIYAQRSITPNVSFEFLNRQLVWEAFTVRSCSGMIINRSDVELSCASHPFRNSFCSWFLLSTYTAYVLAFLA